MKAHFQKLRLLQHIQTFPDFGKVVISYCEAKFYLVINYNQINWSLKKLSSRDDANLHHDFPKSEALDPRIQASDVAHEMKIVGLQTFAEPLVDHGHRQG